MATHDYVIDNQSASAFRTDLNNALQAILTQNSNATAPATTAANMIWYDTANDQIKKRNEANSAWIVLGTVNEGAGTFTPSGGPTLASQAEAEAGTNNTATMTPLRVRNAFNATGSAPVYACRAWVNFDGTGVVAIRASGNVSSITDNAVGDYTINFTTAMPNANYAASMSAGPSSTSLGSGVVRAADYATARTTSSFRLQTLNFSDVLADQPHINVAIFC